MNALIVYRSLTGNTRQLAYEIAKGLKEAGVSVYIKNAKEAPTDLSPFDIVVIGSPTYGVIPSITLLRYLEDLPMHSMEGKVVGAYTLHLGAGGSNAIKMLDSKIKELGASHIQHGPIVDAGFPLVRLRPPTKKQIEECIMFGRKLGMRVEQEIEKKRKVEEKPSTPIFQISIGGPLTEKPRGSAEEYKKKSDIFTVEKEVATELRLPLPVVRESKLKQEDVAKRIRKVKEKLKAAKKAKPKKGKKK